MKKVFSMFLAASMVLAMAGLAVADGNSIRVHNPLGQACTLVLSAPSFSVTGTVSAVSDPDARNGITVSTATEDVTFYGLGPVRYWDGLGIDRPEVGDAVTIEAKAVPLNGSVINTILSLAYEDGTSIQLRDAETGCPLWRGFSRRTQTGSN